MTDRDGKCRQPSLILDYPKRSAGAFVPRPTRGCPGRCCKSEVGAAPPEPVGSGCSIHEEEQRREERYASIGFPDSPECSRDGGRRVGRGRGFRGSSKQL